MSNMSYCRFHNTLADLEDCREAMENMMDHGGEIQGFKEYAKRWNELSDKKDHTDQEEEEFEALHERMEEIREDVEALSDSEYEKARQLLALCREIADEYDEDALIKEKQFEIWEGEHES